MFLNDDDIPAIHDNAGASETPAAEEQPEKPAAVEEATVGTGSYIGVTCAVVMLLLTIVLIGVVYLLRWIG